MEKSFDQNPRFSETYATSQEIWDYFKSFQMRHDLEKQTRTLCEIVGAEWQKSDSLWKVLIQDRSSGQLLVEYCNVLINAGGFLNRWKWPSVPGRSNYAGILIHTAAWPAEVDLTAKRVVVIGNG